MTYQIDFSPTAEAELIAAAVYIVRESPDELHEGE